MQSVRLDEAEDPRSELLEEDVQLMTANLLQIRRQITERDESARKERQEMVYTHQSPWNQTLHKKQAIQHQIRVTYDEYLATQNLPANHEQKLVKLLSEELSIGTAVALFEMLFYFREAINQQVLREISDKAALALRSSSQLSTPMIQCLLELLAICGVFDEQVANFVIEQMLEQKMDFELCFVYLTNVGFPGMASLVDLARQDFKQITVKILDYLSRTEEIITELLLPILLEDMGSAKARERQILLVILNRLNGLTGTKHQLYPILIDMMISDSYDRGMIASVLRSSGLEGEKILLQLATQMSKNEKIMLPIISVLPWRAPTAPVLRIKVIEYSLGSNFLPGKLYQYEGEMEPSAYLEADDNCCDSLCLNARDFLAALQRLITSKISNYQNEESMRTTPHNNMSLFVLHQIVSGSDSEEVQISGEVIKCLLKVLNHPNLGLREAAINSLGLIGLPEAYQTIDEVAKKLWDTDSRNRSMACWALSKLCQNPSRKIVSRLTQLLKDNFWKVRTSACICIGAIVKQPFENVVEALIRCLKDNSVNRITVCETIVQLGQVGEEILLQILKTAYVNDYKLKQSIICALKEANVKSPYIDFVLEEIFKYCKGNRMETRAACLQTLNHLRLRAINEEEEIIYLKAKSILPFFYYFLEDSSNKIREMAVESILSFGSQAELVFIEGITKGSGVVRVESAKGLAKLGIQNFRALVLGLRDEDPHVKKVTSQLILSAFSPEEVAQYYCLKPNQMASLLCNLKDMLVSGGCQKPMKSFIKSVISELQAGRERAANLQDSSDRDLHNKDVFYS